MDSEISRRELEKNKAKKKKSMTFMLVSILFLQISTARASVHAEMLRRANENESA